MNAATLPPPLPSTGVRPADRLGFTLLIATILHLAVILGVSFTLAKPGTLSKSLEIMVGFGHPTARLEASEFNVNL